MRSLMVCDWFQVLLGFLMLQYIAGDCPLSELMLANGEVFYSTSDENQTSAEGLANILFVCDDGHRRIGPEYIQCVDGKWSDDKPFCASQPYFVEEDEVSSTFKTQTEEEVAERATVEHEVTERLDTPTYSSVSLSMDKTPVKKLPQRFILYFVFDVSNSIPERDFRKSIIFSKELVRKVGILKNGTRAGALTFGSEPEIRFMPMDYHTTEGVAEALHKIDFTGGGSALSATLNLIRTECIQGVRDAFSDTNVTFLVLLFTDGKPNMGGDPVEEAHLLKAEGVEIYSIGNTDILDQQLLQDVASTSTRGNRHKEGPNVFMLNSYKTFSTLVMDITNETIETFCDHPRPSIHESILELETSNLDVIPHGFEITYACDEGYSFYWGDSRRKCTRGRWSGKKPKCEVIRCPDPGVPDNGIKAGNDYSVGSSVRFSCFENYELLGSFERYCMRNGQWTGEISRCNIASNYCPDPGTPIRGSKNMTDYKLGDKVRFRCQPKYILVGSEIRKCLLNRTWSGTETKCLSRYDFDDKFEVRDILKTKIGGMTEAKRFLPSDLERDANFPSRSILLFAFDVSRSVGSKNVHKNVELAKAMVRKVGVSANGARVGALTYSLEANAVFSPYSYNTSEDLEDYLDKVNYTGGGSNVSSVLKFIRTTSIPDVTDWFIGERIKYVVFLITNGNTDVGGSAKMEADLLKADGVEINCIGVASDANRKVLYDIASISVGKDGKERPNVYILKDYRVLSQLAQEIWNKNEIFCDHPKPSIHESILELETSNVTVFPHGFEINYACDEGYTIYWGENRRKCTRGRWSGKKPKCEVIRCPDPGVPEKGFKDGTDYSVGSSVRFSCFQNYELLGSFERSCMPNGQWSGEISRCNIASNYCPDPGTPIHGSKNMTEYKMGDKVHFLCDPKYILVGSEIRKCLLDRTWSGTETKCFSRYDFDDKFEVRDILKAKIGKMADAGRFSPSKNILLFAFDVSRNVGSKNVKKNVDLAKAIVRKMGVSAKSTLVGALTYSSEANAVISPHSYNTGEDLEAHLDKVNYTGGESDASSVLKFIRTTYIPHVTDGFRGEGIKYTIFLMSNGNPNLGEYAKMEADLLKADGVEINCIGVANDVNRKVLYDAASTSIGKEGKVRPNVYILKDYRVLSQLAQEIGKEDGQII